MDDNPEIRDCLNVNTATSHNKRLHEGFVCFIRVAKLRKINRLNGPYTIHENSKWLKQSIQSITRLLLSGYAKKSPLKVFQVSYPEIPSTSSGGSWGGAQGAWTPLIFRLNWGPKGWKILFWRPGPPLMSGSGWPGTPLIWRSGSPLTSASR